MGGEGVSALLDEVSELSGQCFNEDSVEKSLKEGWLMSVLATSVPQGGRSLAGFICYRLDTASAELRVIRIAVPICIQKGGYGQHLMHYILTKAARMPQRECRWIALSALDTAVPFYEKFGFTDMTADDLEDPDHFQTQMVLKNLSIVLES